MKRRHDRLVAILTGVNYKRLGQGLVLAFFAAILLGGALVSACRGGLGSDRMTIALCSLSMPVPNYRGEEFGQTERYVQRAHAYANLGRAEAARRDLQTALSKATFRRSKSILKGQSRPEWYWVESSVRFMNRMERLDPGTPLALIWQEVLAPYQPITLPDPVQPRLNTRDGWTSPPM